MLALFFEVRPHSDQMQNYLDTAARLKPELDRVGGCLFIERFRSLQREGVVMSFQLWRDEAAMTAWRTNVPHHGAQMQGRAKVFQDYRLRVAEVVHARLHGEPTKDAAHHGTYNDPAHRAPRHMMMVQSTAAAFVAPLPVESFESLYREGQFLHVLDLPDAATGRRIAESVDATHYAQRVCEIERDYGMFDRAEAPQYCPELPRN